MKHLSLIIIFIGVISLVTSNPLTLPNGTIIKAVNINDKKIQFSFEFNKDGHATIGFGASMRLTDMITVEVSGSSFKVIDKWSAGHTTPSIDTQSNIENIIFTSLGSIKRVTFERLLNTGDADQDVILYANGVATPIITAWGEGPFGFHGRNFGRGTMTISPQKEEIKFTS
jgi:hypothetical protein